MVLTRLAVERRIRTPVLIAFMIAVGLCGSVRGQVPQPIADAATGPETIRQQQPGFLVRAEVNHSTRSYREGQTISLKVVSEVDAFVYVLYGQADGQIFQIFPNSAQPDNRVKARQAVQIATGDDLFRWVVGAPFGKEIIKVIAVKQELKGLSTPELRQKRFNPLSAKALKEVELELGAEEPAVWAEDGIEVTTYPRNQELAASGAKRFGVFFGVSDYEFNAEVERVSDGKNRLNLPTCDRDAQRLAEVLREVGQLNDLKVYTNNLATHANLETAVTRWLPSVSRPGDTVMIYFSGHGAQIPDDNRDEMDGKDELLLPHDFLSIDVLAALVERSKQGQLDPALAPRVASALEVVKQAGTLEKGAIALARKSGVSDDLFGHWLQRLDGRQVVVILDICHAGGFATAEKGPVAPVKVLTFDFLDSELSRLKDLGQKDSALLTACGAQESAAIRVQNDLSVMTKYLIDGVGAAPASLTLEQAHRSCEVAMKEYFGTLNQALQNAGKLSVPGHRPYVFNYCSKPVFLKP